MVINQIIELQAVGGQECAVPRCCNYLPIVKCAITRRVCPLIQCKCLKQLMEIFKNPIKLLHHWFQCVAEPTVHMHMHAT